MTIEEAMRDLKLKFSSGNNISVERATIIRDEFEAICNFYNEVTMAKTATVGHQSIQVVPVEDSDVGC